MANFNELSRVDGQVDEVAAVLDCELPGGTVFSDFKHLRYSYVFKIWLDFRPALGRVGADVKNSPGSGRAMAWLMVRRASKSSCCHASGGGSTAGLSSSNSINKLAKDRACVRVIRFPHFPKTSLMLCVISVGNSLNSASVGSGTGAPGSPQARCRFTHSRRR